MSDLDRQVAEALDCPYCPNQGWFEDADPWTGDPIQVQCEFCYTEANSVFNMKALVASKERDDE